MATLEAIKYGNGKLTILNQLLLPHETVYIEINNIQDAAEAIATMKVRGAPAIALVGCLALNVELNTEIFTDKTALKKFIANSLQKCVDARPTAVNMSKATFQLNQFADKMVENSDCCVKQMKLEIMNTISEMLKCDYSDNKAIGLYGAKEIFNVYHHGDLNVLTHCNTGSLATGNYGTALGVVRSLYENHHLSHCFCTETRPYNQGSRLTAYELLYEKIPSTLICDSAVSALMSTKKIHAVLVGADRVARNGDTANKIGTLQIAIVAKHFKVPFYVCAPLTSVDWTIHNGSDIVIEERCQDEILFTAGKRFAAEGVVAWNPAFDVTPATLITGIITEKGVYKPENLNQLMT